MMLCPVMGNRCLGGLQLLPEVGCLRAQRGLGALRRRYLGLNFDIPIAINVSIDDRGGSFGCPGPVRNAYRHRMSVSLDGQITRIYRDRRVDLRLRWWIGNSGLGALNRLPSRAILRTGVNFRFTPPYATPYLSETGLHGLPTPASGVFHFLK